MHSLSNPMTNSFRADLHCHSSCSDGSLSVEALIDLAIAEGLQGLSITDHDTLNAYVKGIPYAKEKGLILKPGVELSCDHKKKSVHILAYDFFLESPELISYCQRQQSKRMARNRQILEKLARLQMIIKEEELLACHVDATTLGRPHIASIMVQKGYVQSVQEAFDRYIGDGKCCFILGQSFPVTEAIDVIHRAKGKAFLAHPHLFTQQAFVRELLQMGFDGIECFYGRFSYLQEKQWLKLAQEFNLLISGGSDFHGQVKPKVSLGCSFVDLACFNAIFTNNTL